MIIIAVGSSVTFFIGAALSIILFLRASDRKRRNKDDAARQFSAGQRGRLSVGSANYSNVPQPRANLRRSTHLPYGVVSEGWAAIPSQETLPQYQRILTYHLPGSVDEPIRQKRRRSLRASFSAHSFSLPKTRRQKKIEKAVPLRSMPLSPLSAITERSGTNTTEASPSVGIAELPTEMTPKNTPDKDGEVLPMGRPVSAQWPLTSAKRVSSSSRPTIIPVPPSRNSSLSAIDSSDFDISPTRPSFVTRSTSMASTLSIAPEDPLPPLPSITPSQWPLGRKMRFRLSASSVDTIGSSVLGGGPTSPLQAQTDQSSMAPVTHGIDHNSNGLQAYARESQGWEPATVITTGSPKARQATRYSTGKAGYGSLRANLGHQMGLRNTKTEQGADSVDRANALARPIRLQASIGELGIRSHNLPSRTNSVVSSVTYSNTDHFAGSASGHKNAANARHSMYEQYSGLGKLAMGPDVLHHTSGNRSSPSRRRASSRPALIASENPFHWDRNSLQTGLPPGLRSSPGSQRKGHKRQNCVRISNIPTVDTSRRASTLPQMTEEEEDTTETTSGQTTTIPGLSLLDHGKRIITSQSRPDQGQESSQTSPFLSQPLLEPTSWKRPRYPHAPSGDSTASPNRDSDIFSNSRYDPNAPNIFAQNSTPRQPWPLSPSTPKRIKAQPKTPSLQAIQEPYDPDSPTLPVPAISSATLFARALPLGPRVSVVQGPRTVITSSRLSRITSPSPMIARSAGKQEDLRRSAITLRRMNSDTKNKTPILEVSSRVSDESTSISPGAGRRTEQAGRPSDGGMSVGGRIQSPHLPNTNLQIPSSSDSWVSASPWEASTLMVSGLRLSKSRNKVEPSPSIMSAGATSIWEDASVRDDSPEPELRLSSKAASPQLIDVEAYENFIGQDKRSHKDEIRESGLTSPQGKGLGLIGVQLQEKVWGTPGSLYDVDGFLKD